MTQPFSIRTKNRGFEGFTKEREGQWQGPFCFIQAADTQFGMIESYIEKKTQDVKWEKEIILTKKAISAANKLNPKPRFFVVCGDLIDAMPGTHDRKAQENDFRKTFEELKSEIPLVCVCGNHDIGNTPTVETIDGYRSVFGDDYFVFWCGGVMCIVINSQFYEDPSMVQDLAKEQDTWLDEQLSEAKSNKYKHVIVFQHIPWFLKDPYEGKDYFNIATELRLNMLKKFKNAGVSAIFCGHYHRNAGGFYENMELVVTSAIGAQLGTDKSGIRIVSVLEDSIKHKYCDLENVPHNISFP